MENEKFNNDIDTKKEDIIVIPSKFIRASERGLENSELEKMVKTLMNVIDRLDTDSKHARELILDIARILDESKQCARNQICRSIKQTLRDKITEGKITSKWIEECLPKEYKREYKKSELTSLSNQTENAEVENGNGLVIMQKPNNPKGQRNSDIPLYKDTRHNQYLINPKSEEQEINELTDTELDKKTSIIPTKLVINKDQKKLIDRALDDCKVVCFLIFNKLGILADVTPDRSVEVP